ncbi:MAG TPA: CheR family methyltransferase [Bryobacteraceae bacterium]|nr:CheR family methyltransferase [Bryobacteraceae bacterium]
MPASDLHPESYRFLQDYVYSQSGIVLEGDKRYLLEARLMPIVKQVGLSNLNDLCAMLGGPATNAVLRRQVIEAMTTNETFFFRDPAQYDALRTVVVPSLILLRQDTRKISFWSAASSSGQEAYSLAMMLLEMGLGGWKIKIQGTDLSTQMAERAGAGKYLQIEVNRGLPVGYLVKYFTRAGLEWQLKDEVRRMVDFTTFDLRQRMSARGPFDVVFCRNVLIYFDVEAKRKVLDEIHGTLFRGGYLLLGGSETTLNLTNRFERRIIGQAVLYQAS